MAEKIVFELEVNGEGAAVAGTKFKTQLRQAKEEAQLTAIALGATSKEAIAAAQKVANMQEELADVKDTINALHPEAKLNAVAGAVQGIAGGFAAAEGAMALFGTQSEDVQKQLVKIQGALALSQGINQVLSLGDSFKNLQIMLKATAAYQVAYNFVTAASTAGMKLFRLALIGTGIGALAVGIGLLIANFETLQKWVKENTDKIKQWGEFIIRYTTPIGLLYTAIEKLGHRFEIVQKIIDKVKEHFGILWEAIREGLEAINVLDTAEENAAQDNLERVETRIQANDRLYKQMEREIEIMKAQGASANELREKEKELLDLRLKDYQDFVNAKIAAGEEITADEQNQLDDLKNQKQLAAINDERLDKEEADKARKIRQDKYKKLKDDADKAQKQKEADEQAARDKALELQRLYEDEVIKSITDSYQRERQELITSFDRRIQDIKGSGEMENNLRLQIETNKQQALDGLQEKYRQDQAQKEIDAIKSRYDQAQNLLQAQLIRSQEGSAQNFQLQLDLEESQFREKLETENLTNEEIELATAEHEQRKAEIQAAAREKEKQEDQKLKDAKISLQKNTFSAISSLGNLFIKDAQKAEAFQKKIAIAQLAIDTAKSISSTIAGATAAAAAGGPAAPFLLVGYITAGLATVLGAFSQAKKILGDSGSTQAPSLGGGGAGAAPNVRFTSTETPTSNLSGVKRNDDISTAPIKAVVVETDITKKQKRVSSVEETATF
jgi:hypothetical protein